MRSLNLLIWHLHGGYLYYMTKRSRHKFYVPFREDRRGDYIGAAGHMPWPSNLVEVPADEVRKLDLDAVIFQNPSQYAKEQFQILSPEQRNLPKIYIEHDPPQQHPTNTEHPVNDPNVMMVHVTHFNRLMWDTRQTPSVVIEHGVEEHPGVFYNGKREKGIVVVNHLKKRGRRLGFDVYEEVRSGLPLDLIGMGSLEVAGGIGEILHGELSSFMAEYRFFFNPIRYTSLGLAVCEAMMTGLPVIGLATTEMVTVVQNGVNGFVDTNLKQLTAIMKTLLEEPDWACQMGRAAKKVAVERFSLERFTQDWDVLLSKVAGPEIFPIGPLNTIEENLSYDSQENRINQ